MKRQEQRVLDDFERAWERLRELRRAELDAMLHRLCENAERTPWLADYERDAP